MLQREQLTSWNSPCDDGKSYQPRQLASSCLFNETTELAPTTEFRSLFHASDELTMKNFSRCWQFFTVFRIYWLLTPARGWPRHAFLIKFSSSNPSLILNHWIKSPRTHLSSRVVRSSSVSHFSYFFPLIPCATFVARLYTPFPRLFKWKFFWEHLACCWLCWPPYWPVLDSSYQIRYKHPDLFLSQCSVEMRLAAIRVLKEVKNNNRYKLLMRKARKLDQTEQEKITTRKKNTTIQTKSHVRFISRI